MLQQTHSFAQNANEWGTRTTFGFSHFPEEFGQFVPSQ